MLRCVGLSSVMAGQLGYVCVRSVEFWRGKEWQGSYGLAWLGLAIVFRWQLRRVMLCCVVLCSVTSRQLWCVMSSSVRSMFVMSRFVSAAKAMFV